MPTFPPRAVLLPVVVGFVALVLAVGLAYITVRDTTGPEPAAAEPTTTTGTTPIPTDRMVSEEGGFAIAVPRDLDAERAGGTVQLVSRTKDLVVMVGPAGDGTLRRAERRVLDEMKSQYRKLAVLGREPLEVDDRPAQTVFGQAVNETGAKVRFAVITVHADDRNFTMAAYTAYDADPSTVLPRVNAIANGFEVLES